MEFFEHISICSDDFLYLYPQTREIYHGKVKSYSIIVVLAERDLNNKWLSDKLGKDEINLKTIMKQ